MRSNRSEAGRKTLMVVTQPTRQQLIPNKAKQEDTITRIVDVAQFSPADEFTNSEAPNNTTFFCAQLRKTNRRRCVFLDRSKSACVFLFVSAAHIAVGWSPFLSGTHKRERERGKKIHTREIEITLSSGLKAHCVERALTRKTSGGSESNQKFQYDT